MKKSKLTLLAAFFLTFIQVIIPQSKTGDLPVLDFSKDYPKKRILIQDVADIEHIALETTDKVLLSDKAILSAVTDNHILIHEPDRGDIFVFNRSGKTVYHFNHKGSSGREYPSIFSSHGSSGTILDEKNKEIYVCYSSIQVYSMSGEYRRTLPVKNNAESFESFQF